MQPIESAEWMIVEVQDASQALRLEYFSILYPVPLMTPWWNAIQLGLIFSAFKSLILKEWDIDVSWAVGMWTMRACERAVGTSHI